MLFNCDLCEGKGSECTFVNASARSLRLVASTESSYVPSLST
jgi:hypothetical protein